MSQRSEHDRYIRQSQFAPIGTAGQAKIQKARVAVLGCGALGSVAAELLCRAGVGDLRLIDRDLVEWSNLQRQSLYDTDDARSGAAKAEAAARHLRRINDSIHIEERVLDVHAGNVNETLADCDLVMDGSDNFGLRFLLNDWSLKTGVPWVHGGCIGSTGQVRLFTGKPPCFRCLLPSPPPPGSVATCDTAGVLGTATHTIASLQVTEAIKWITGNSSDVHDEVLSIDLWSNQFRKFKLSAMQNCPACRQHEFAYLHTPQSATPAETLCGRDAVQISAPTKISQKLDLPSVAARWRGSGEVEVTRFFARLHLPSEQTLTLFRDGRAVISGVRDISHARSLYDRFVGS